jgi:predicted DCC family thiol-disulfide oxidoreductase YuxK
MAGAIMLYDGECGLCSRSIQFILPRDRKDRFRFAALQGAIGQSALDVHRKPKERFDTFYLLLDEGTPRERLLEKSTAALAVLRSLGGAWSVLGTALWIIPRPLRDAAYEFIASHRYGWFGKSDACAIPKPEWRHKFVP